MAEQEFGLTLCFLQVQGITGLTRALGTKGRDILYDVVTLGLFPAGPVCEMPKLPFHLALPVDSHLPTAHTKPLSLH